MAFTIQNVIDRVRLQISDSVADSAGAYRWSDSSLRDMIYDGVLDVSSEHPEAKYIGSIVTTALASFSQNTDTFPLRDEYMTAVVDFVASRILQEDSEDSSNLVLAKVHTEGSILNRE
jgi:hypothetical protein